MRRLQLLLSDQARTDEARASLVRELEALGCTVTGVGAASLSIRVSDEAYCRIFDGPSTAAADRPTRPAATIFVAPAGLTIPASLQPYLASVSEAPAHDALGTTWATSAGLRRTDAPDD